VSTGAAEAPPGRRVEPLEGPWPVLREDVPAAGAAGFDDSARPIVTLLPTWNGIDVKVYTNLDEATLVVDGACLGSRRASNHVATWADVKLSPGVQHRTAAGADQ